MRHGGARGAYLRHHLDFHVQVPEIVVDLVERDLARAAGVVDHDVQTAEMFGGLVDEPLHVAFLGGIGNDAEDVTALLFQFSDHRVDQFLAARAERHFCTFRHQAPHRRPADAFGAAGDRSDFPL